MHWNSLGTRLVVAFTALVLAATVLVGPLVMTAMNYPWGLTFYTPLVGGAPGAASQPSIDSSSSSQPRSGP